MSLDRDLTDCSGFLFFFFPTSNIGSLFLIYGAREFDLQSDRVAVISRFAPCAMIIPSANTTSYLSYLVDTAEYLVDFYSVNTPEIRSRPRIYFVQGTAWVTLLGTSCSRGLRDSLLIS